MVGDEIAGGAWINSTSLSVAPAALCKSPQTSEREPMDPDTNAAYKTNWVSWPVVICPAPTCSAPTHKTRTITPKARAIARAVNKERVLIRFLATSKAISTES